MKYIDVTVPIRPDMPLYETDPPVSVERVSSLATGGICNLSLLSLGLHSGTHIDAPLHFIDGAPGVEATPLEVLIGDAVVVDASGIDGVIDSAALAGLAIPAGCERVLFKTSNSELWADGAFHRDFVALGEDAALDLVRRGVRLAGIDYLSIAPFTDPAPAHLALLRAGVVILEGLDLRRIQPGNYRLFCLPLLVEGADGAPARTLLLPI